MNSNALVDDQRITTFGRLVEAHSKLRQLLDRDLEEEAGLPLLWYGVLLHVARSPHGVRPISELVNATAFTSGGVTRLVDRMEAAGLLERHPCPSDRRVQWIGLTAKGRDLLDRGTAVHLRGIQAYIIDCLDTGDSEELNRILAKIIAA